MMMPDCDFDEGFYADYFDQDSDDQSELISSLYIGSQMHGKKNHGKLFVISGPSGVGKTTVALELLKILGKSHNLERVITYTTKTPRSGEQDGIDYHFISVADFESKLANGFFMEYSQAYGHYYGSPKNIMSELQSGRSFLLVADQVGAYNIKKQFSGAVIIWLTPPSLAELSLRLTKRASDSDTDIAKRMSLATHELANEQNNQYFDYLIENNILAQTILKLVAIVKAEIQSGSSYSQQ